MSEFQLVLNDGKAAIDSATIPMRWFFPKEIIDRQQTELLVVVQHESEYGVNDRGERWRVPIIHGQMWLPFSRAGRHQILVFALAHGQHENHDYESYLHNRMTRLGPRAYDFYITYNEESRDNNLSGYIVGRASVEVEVPDGLFAKKPKGFLGRLLWKWVNWGYGWEPSNECIYEATPTDRSDAEALRLVCTAYGHADPRSRFDSCSQHLPLVISDVRLPTHATRGRLLPPHSL